MATTIVTKYGSDAPAASDIVRGELAVDTENGRLYTENSSGAVVEIGLNPEGNVDVTGTVTADGLTVSGSGAVGSFDRTDANAIIELKRSGSLQGYIGASTSGDVILYNASAAQKFRAADNGDISFYEDTGTTAKLFWDASAESLGIGTSSPSSSAGWGTLLEVSGTTNAGIKLTETDTANGDFSLGVTAGTFRIWDETATAFRLTLDGSGNVGIGRTDPKGPLHVYGSNYAYIGPNVAGVTPDATTGGIAIGWNKSSGQGESIIAFNKGAGATGGLVFADNNGGTYAERMRLDSSGNLLVGTTNVNPAANNVTGHALKAGGLAEHANSGAVVMRLNRTDSDGDILQFYKGTSTVGSIATLSSALTIGTGDTGVQFNADNNAVMPHNISTGANVDASIDLGYSSGGTNRRFKDLFLSGGAYLGGTGAANHLDDYEEGTFSATFAGSTTNPSVTFAVNSCTYLKVGQMVSIQIRVRTTSITSQGAGELRIGGLPFVASGAVGGLYSAASIGYAVQWDTDNTPSGGYIPVSQSYITLIKYTGDDPRDALSSSVDASSLSVNTNGNHVILQMTYRTT